MRRDAPFIAVLIAVGLLLSTSLGAQPDSIEDDDSLLPGLDANTVQPSSDELPETRSLPTVTWWDQKRDSGREFSAAIFHPPI